MARGTADVGGSIKKARGGTLDRALRFTGDRLVCLPGPDGFTRIDEKKHTKKGAPHP